MNLCIYFTLVKVQNQAPIVNLFTIKPIGQTLQFRKKLRSKDSLEMNTKGGFGIHKVFDGKMLPIVTPSVHLLMNKGGAQAPSRVQIVT